MPGRRSRNKEWKSSARSSCWQTGYRLSAFMRIQFRHIGYYVLSISFLHREIGLATEAQTAFFSYSRDDSEFALRLAEDLKAAGASVWLDQLDIEPGQEWDRAIESALTQSPRMLLILSVSSAKPRNVRNEISLALDEEKTILPVLYQDCTIPLQLRRVQHVDFRTDYARGLKALLKTLDVVQSADRSLPASSEVRKKSTADVANARPGLESGHSSAMTSVAATVPQAPAAQRGKLWRIAVPVALVALLVASGLYYRSHQTMPLTDKDTIVLADFDNKTGDAVFDDTLKQGLSVQLEQSPFLALVSDSKVNQTLKLMGRPAGDRLTPAVTREVCQRTGSKAMLTGSIAALGNQYVVGLKAADCNTGDVLAEAQEQAASKEAVLKALDSGAVSLRSNLGESLSSVQKYSTPLEEATTPSLEALKAYSLGRKASLANGETAALPLFKRAVELDSNFAAAYQAMSIVYSNRDEAGRAAEYARKAYELREKVTQRERFSIEASYYWDGTGELEKAAQVYELWQQTYPRDASPYTNLGAISITLGTVSYTHLRA